MFLTKKYQYLFLKEKIKLREEKLIHEDNFSGVTDYYWEKETKRINCLYFWLDKINEKYDYA